MNQFAALVDEESDADRLPCYCGDVHGLVKQTVNAFEPETTGRTRMMPAAHFRRQRLDERRN
jgi:hypothetical protein